jgi:phage-related protein
VIFLVLNEFLVALGLQDNMTQKLNTVTKAAEQKVGKMTRSFAKNFALAGTAVAAFVATAAVGVFKFTEKLAKADSELTVFARKLGLPKEEAYKVKSALDAMGKSMEEIALNPELLRQFEELKKNSADLSLPDMAGALKPFREINTEINKLKQTASNVLQWVGYYFLKYVQKPMDDIKKLFSGFNDIIKRNIPEWGSNIAKALAWVVRLGGTIIRGAGIVFNAIKRVFDMIPNRVTGVIAVLGVLFAFLKLSPVGRIIAIISAAMLLLDDFFTYLDGGDALLGGFWEKLIGVWNIFKDNGGIEKTQGLLKAVTDLFGTLWDSVKGVAASMLGLVFPKDTSGALDYIVGTIVPGALDGLTLIVNAINSVVNKLKDMGLLTPAIKSFLLMFVKNPFLKMAISLGIVKDLFDLLTGNKTVGEFFDGLITKVSDMATSMGNTVSNLVKGLPGFINSLISKVQEFWPDIVKAGSGIVNSLIEGAQALLPNITGSAGGLVTTIINVIKTNLPKIIQSGKDILFSLIEGAGKILPNLINEDANLITVIINEITKLLPRIVDIGVSILQSIIDGIVTILPKLVDTAVGFLTSIITAITENLPTIIDAGIKILTSLIEGITDTLPDIVEAVLKIVTSLIDAVTKNLPTIIDAGIKILTSLIEGITDALPDIITAVLKIVSSLISAITDNLPTIIEAGISILMSLIQGVVDALPQLVSAAVSLITSILDAIVENLPTIIDAGLQILTSLISGILDNLPAIVTAVFDIITKLISSLTEKLPEIISMGVEMLMALVTGLIDAIPDLVAKLPEIITALVNGLAGLGGQLLEAGASFGASIWDGIKSAFAGIAAWFTDIFSGAWQGVKDVFSTGGKIFDGIKEGIVDTFKTVVNGIIGGINKVIKIPFDGINAALSGIKGVNIFGIKPFDWLPTLDVPQIPLLARGGVLKRGQIGILEGSGAEAVVPLEQNTGWIKKVAETLMTQISAGNSGIGAAVNNIGAIVGNAMQFMSDSIKQLSSGSLTELSSKMNEFLDNANRVMLQMGQSASASYSTTNSRISYDNRTYDQKSTFHITDTSGEPRVVADMVDKNQSLRIRNMRGAFA